jgi:hypothetical protein
VIGAPVLDRALDVAGTLQLAGMDSPDELWHFLVGREAQRDVLPGRETFFLPVGDYASFLDCQQEINLALVRELKAAGINLLSQKSSPPALRAPEKESASPSKSV